MIIDTDDYLSIPEAAVIVGTSRENMTFLAKRLPEPLLFKGRKYFKRDVVEAFKKEYVLIKHTKKVYGQ